METNVITGEIVRAAMKVHTALGPGLPERVYRKCLCHELIKCGLHVVMEKPIQIVYDDVRIGTGLRLDLLVEDQVIVEVKAVEKHLPLHQSQLLSHLKLTGVRNRSFDQLQRQAPPTRNQADGPLTNSLPLCAPVRPRGSTFFTGLS
jgi:GxxExxY protein